MDVTWSFGRTWLQIIAPGMTNDTSGEVSYVKCDLRVTNSAKMGE
jgi:hypothetical protein